MQVQWTDRAENDRENAIEYIAQDNLTAALNQLDEIEEQIDRLAEYPKLGRPGRVNLSISNLIRETANGSLYQL